MNPLPLLAREMIVASRRPITQHLKMGFGGGLMDHLARTWMVGSVSIADDETSIAGDACDFCPAFVCADAVWLAVPEYAANRSGKSGDVLRNLEPDAGVLLRERREISADRTRPHAAVAAVQRETAAHREFLVVY